MSTSCRMEKLELSGYRGFPDAVTLDLHHGLNLLVGGNGSGKSSALTAIEWCLFGDAIAKKSSGIAERADWVVAHRSSDPDAPEASVTVKLTFATQAGPATLVRGRAARARRDALALLIQDELIEDSEGIEAWLEEQGLPTWDTYKSGFAQHQEITRARLLDQRSRSDQLAQLLGIGAARDLHDEIAQQGKICHDARRAAEDQLDRLAERLRDRSQAPSLPDDSIDAQLTAMGFDLERRTDSALRAHVHRSVEAAKRTLRDLEIEFAAVAAPLPTELDELLAFLDDWPEACRRERNRTREAIDQAEAQINRIGRYLDNVQPARLALQRARETRATLEVEHGRRQDIQEQLQATEKELERKRKELGLLDRHAAILDSCRELLESVDTPDDCPVCGHRDPALASRLDQALEELRSDASIAVKESIEAGEARAARLRDHLQAFENNALECSGAEAAMQRSHKDLLACIEGTNASDPGSQDIEELIARADVQRRQIGEDARRFRTALRGIEGLPDLEDERQSILLYQRWQSAKTTQQPADESIEHRPEWQAIDDELDELAGLCTDLDSLASIARTLEEQLSRDRLAAVNETLGSWFACITGKDTHGLAIREKRTASKLSYRIVDAAGEDLTPILNQAALNALAFALLFALAEDRVRQGLPQWLVMDEPAQNLDDRHQLGLAQALARMAEVCPVLVASLPGPFANKLRKLEGCREIAVANQQLTEAS